MMMEQETDLEINRMILREGWAIPDTELRLYDYEGWILVDGRPVKGRVQLGTADHAYVTLEFRVVEWDGVYQTKIEAEAAAKTTKPD